MGRTVRELCDALGADELVEWGAFYSLEPWGCGVEDQRAGTVSAAVTNSQRAKGRAVTPEDYFPPRDRPRGGGRKTPEEIMAAMAVVRAQQGG